MNPQLYFDKLSNMYVLDTQDEEAEAQVLFLGPMTTAMLKLKEIGLNAAQAREAVLRAFFNSGAAINLDDVQRMVN